MPALSSIATVGDKLIVGQVDTSFLTATGRVTPGTAVLNGPVYCGLSPQIGIARATVMIGPPLPGLTAPASLEVTGIANIIGIFNVTAVSTFTGLTTKLGTTIKNALSLKNGVDLKNAINIGNGVSVDNAAAIVNGTETVGGVLQAPTAVIPIVNGYCTGNKPFDIPHWKRKGKRLRHVCAEGPEAGIYIRGRLTNQNTIELPEYWDGLVDPESISVNLTPVGRYQELYVDQIPWGKSVIVKSGNAAKIDCFYEVWAARWIDPRDHDEKLHVVYDGESPDDYPGNNKNFLIGGWDYDKRDPQWGV
mgnify:FL=1